MTRVGVLVVRHKDQTMANYIVTYDRYKLNPGSQFLQRSTTPFQ